MTRPLAKILNRNRIQPCHQLVLQGDDKGRDDAHAQVGPRCVFFLVIFDAFRHPHHIAHRNATAFARQPIAAARAAHALENSGADKLLHHLFEIALRHALSGGDLLGLYRLGPGIEGDVDYRLQRQKRLARQLQHYAPSFIKEGFMPVEPNPPAPRSLSLSESTSTSSACAWRATTIWAIFMPRVIWNTVSLWLIRMALISPR
jgi:hypothetical protein